MTSGSSRPTGLQSASRRDRERKIKIEGECGGWTGEGKKRRPGEWIISTEDRRQDADPRKPWRHGVSCSFMQMAMLPCARGCEPRSRGLCKRHYPARTRGPKYSRRFPLAPKSTRFTDKISKKNEISVEGQNLERRNVERSIFRNFKITNLKITNDELIDNSIFEFNFSFFRNHFNTQNIQ